LFRSLFCYSSFNLVRFCFYFFFFFQAEDGIRDRNVTGVQTCALPISAPAPGHVSDPELRAHGSEFHRPGLRPEERVHDLQGLGTTGYAYRTDVITRPMESWQDFIDAAQDEAAGRTSLLSDAWEVAAIGLAARGYGLNSTDEKELEEARKIIVDEVAPNVRAYFGSASTGMIQGSFDLMQ